MHLFFEYYGIPNGLIWGNIAAEPVIAIGTLLILWLFRHALMSRFVAFHHKHKVLHAKKLEAEGKLNGVPRGQDIPRP